MNELFKYLQKLPSAVSIIALFLALMFLIISKWDLIIKSVKLLKNGKNKKSKRTCGDCVLLLFGIREKYEYENRRLDNNLLRMQMKFAEQKIQEVIFFLSQDFVDDIKIYGEGKEQEEKSIQSAMYCEALKNSLLSVKDEIRRSFKENGFGQFSEGEYTHYVKDKTKIMITMIRSYLNQHYVDTDSTIVHLKKRFDKMDEKYGRQFESWTFEIFTNAKDLQDETVKKKEKLQENLKKEIDNFIKNERTPQNC